MKINKYVYWKLKMEGELYYAKHKSKVKGSEKE